MLCDDCKKNEATFHSIRNINGVKTETHLCAECQKKHGYQYMPLSGIGDMFSSFTQLFGDNNSGLICPKCGTTSDEFLSTGYVGCEECYNQFASLILPRVRQMQTKVLHVGKSPKHKVNNKLTELDRLKAELTKAVELEDCQKAAEIDAKIKKLEKKE